MQALFFAVSNLDLLVPLANINYDRILDFRYAKCIDGFMFTHVPLINNGILTRI
jgi:hypothetical protein